LRLPRNFNREASKTSTPNPPSFYDEDQMKWKKKFSACVKERALFKKRFYNGTFKNVLTHTNDNILETEHNDADNQLKKIKYTGG
jgi:hypothetical protein